MTARRSSPLLIGLAFAAVYVIWGSTYLGIRLAIDTIPALAMAGMRFVLAGLILFPIALLTGDAEGDRPTLRQWRSALVVGILLLAGGNGMVTFGEQYVPSGVTALLVASVPLWMALFAHVRGIASITRLGALGLAIGFVGVALLLRPGTAGTSSVGWVLFTLCAPVAWALGSLYARSAPMPKRPLLGTAMEMLCGGAVLCVAATVHGDWGGLHLAAISLKSALAFAYLVVFGALIAYTAYVYLLGVVSPAAVSSYAYVNPLVAVGLGWAVLSEPVSPTTLLAGALIVIAVVMLLAAGREPRRRTRALTATATSDAR